MLKRLFSMVSPDHQCFRFQLMAIAKLGVKWSVCKLEKACIQPAQHVITVGLAPMKLKPLKNHGAPPIWQPPGSPTVLCLRFGFGLGHMVFPQVVFVMLPGFCERDITLSCSYRYTMKHPWPSNAPPRFRSFPCRNITTTTDVGFGQT